MNNPRRKKIFRWIIGIVLTIILLPVVLLLLLQLPPVQHFMRGKAESYLQKQLKTNVRIGGLRISWWNAIKLTDVYVEDTRKDTLLSSGELSVRYNLLSLLRNELSVHTLRWEDAVVNIYRPMQDSAFNYQFVIDAFSTPGAAEDTLIDESGTTLRYNIGNVQLDRIYVRFNDSLGGMLANIRLKKLEALPDTLQPENGMYYLRNFDVDGLNASIRQLYRPVIDPPPPPIADTVAAAFNLGARQLNIRNTQWSYSDETSGLETNGTLGRLELRKLRFSLLETLIAAEELTLEKTVATLDIHQGRDTTAAPPDTTSANTWRVVAGQVNVRETDFAMNNYTAKKLGYKEAVDYNYIGLTGLRLDAGDIYYSADSTLLTVRDASLKEQSGLELRRLTGKVRYTPQEAQLKDFILQTGASHIAADLQLLTPSWDALSAHPELMKITADVRPSQLTLREALYFVPDMGSNPSMAPLWKKRLDLKGKLGGTLARMEIPGIEVKDNDRNYLYIKGDAYQVTNTEKVGADITTLTLRTTRQGMLSWLPPGTLPANMQLPGRLDVDGSIRGGIQLLRPDLAIKTDMGNANIRGEVADFTDMEKIRYQLALDTRNLQAGRILGDTAMGNLSGKVTANGKGTDPQKANIKTGVNITSFTYNRYTYQNILLDATLIAGAYGAKGSIRDPNAEARFDLKGRLDTLHPDIALRADLDKLDLMATHWTTSPMSVKTCLEAEVANLRPRRLEAWAIVSKIQLADAENLYSLDSIQLRAGVVEGLQRISLTGPFGFITANGDFNYQTFATDATNMVTRHLEAASATAKAKKAESQWLHFNGSIAIPKSLAKLLPDLELRRPVTLEGRMDTDSSLLLANITIPGMRYDSFRVDTLIANVSADSSKMAADVLLGRLRHPQIPLGRTRADLTAANGLLDWNLVMGRRASPRYRLGGLVQYGLKDSLVISLKKDLLLNRQEWDVSGDNKVLILHGGVAFADIGLQRGAQELKITSAPLAQGALLPDLTVLLKDFRLSTVTSLIEKDTALAEGITNGTFTVSDIEKTPLVDGNLTIDSLAVMGASLGRLAATAKTNAEMAVALDATLKGQGNDNDLRVSGTYADAMDIRLDITKLNMQSVQPFTFGNVTEMSGHLTGNATLKGTMDDPDILGNFHFEKVAGRITMINSIMRLPSEDLALDQTGVKFNNFVIADSSGNEAVITGDIRTTDYEAFNLNLDLTAENFQALGPQDPKNKDQFYYGPAFVDVTAQIRGTLDLPRVQMKLKLREKSMITVMIPEEEPGIADRAGVVQFIDPAMWLDTSLRPKPDTLARVTGLKGFVVSADVEVTPESTMKLIIDQSNGDYLEVKGTATLNLTMDPSSKMSLTGRYEINEGKYAMSLSQLIKREFQIEKGSTIIWTGDPMSADVDITARYEVNAVAGDLVQDAMAAEGDNTRRDRFRQKVPVYVFLKITGELLKPAIAFELDMPEKDQGVLNGVVYTRIKQINQVESELNKQVMGLLVLNRFISDNPFESLSSGGNPAEDIARNSVSKILSQQLNNLAGSLVKGVDINFDLESQKEYNDAGTQQENTNLKVDVSKRLFNDRLTVSVGSNIGISGAQTQGQDASSIIGDMSAEYMLTEDGRYRIRAYQRNLTEAVIQGQVVETGLTFMLIMDYNEFREILGRQAKKTKKQKLRDK
ncbi:translocation/assembly module TamB domain-containing protein [Chitinophaga pollutisoli]|uniref:Translocation/assembly module TamB domain-containing protein n=1 Tax=Chitinophaga pollutisoli TaxID=3133966 RepID=A0ABZ2YP65_9BACT